MTFYTAPLFLLRDCNRHHTTNIYSWRWWWWWEGI